MRKMFGNYQLFGRHRIFSWFCLSKPKVVANPIKVSFFANEEYSVFFAAGLGVCNFIKLDINSRNKIESFIMLFVIYLILQLNKHECFLIKRL